MPGTPTLPEAIAGAIESRLRELHVSMPGKVKSYNPATQRADVIPVVQAATPKSDGSVLLEDLPVIPNVPVRWPKANGCYLHFPMVAGDWVELIFNEAAIGQWRETGQVPAPPGDLTRHGLSYPYALPCAGPDDDVFGDAPANAAVIIVGDHLRISSEGGTADFVALASLVTARLDAIQSVFDAHTHPTGVGPSGPPASPIGALAAVACVTLKAELP
jgi:hypothetical protein